MDDLSLAISVVSTLIAAGSLAHTRSKDSSDEVDRKIAQAVDDLRADVRRLDRESVSRGDLRDAVRDMSERIGGHEGRIAAVLEAIAGLRERIAARGRGE